MKSIRLVALSALMTVGTFAAIVYSSCTKDACKGVTCQNNGTCSGGACKCPSGVGGANCETVYRTLYAYTYKGNGTDNLGGTYTNNKLIFSIGSDTSDYTKMSLQWVDGSGVGVVTMPIMIANNTASGSTFTVVSTTSDTFTYTGTGTVNGATANLSLTEATPHAPAVIYTFNNFNKQ